MGYIVVDSKVSVQISTPVRTWKDDPRFTLSAEDFRTLPKRTVRRAIIHTTLGIWPQILGSVDRRSDRAENVASYWRRNKSSAATTLIFDSDGSCVQTHALHAIAAWHAGSASLNSIGIECVQLPDGSVFPEVQAPPIAELLLSLRGVPGFELYGPPSPESGGLPTLDVRTRYPTDGKRPLRPALDLPGVWGHRDTDPKGRGRGDPGDAIMHAICRELREKGRGVVFVREV